MYAGDFDFRDCIYLVLPLYLSEETKDEKYFHYYYFYYWKRLIQALLEKRTNYVFWPKPFVVDLGNVSVC